MLINATSKIVLSSVCDARTTALSSISYKKSGFCIKVGISNVDVFGVAENSKALKKNLFHYSSN